VEAMSNISARVSKREEQESEVAKGIPVYDEEVIWES
jgi:hypothetical protein